MAKNKDGKANVQLTIPVETHEKLRFWAGQADVPVVEYIREAIELKLGFEVGDFPMTTLHERRMNEMIDQMNGQRTSMDALAKVVVDMADSLTGLARGDNDYLADENGEIARGSDGLVGDDE